MKKFKLFTKSVSFILTLLIIFYAIPTVIFAELKESLTAEEAVASGEDTASDAIGNASHGIYEVAELREENVKTFRLSDGSFVAAQYNSPVHRLDSEGKWQDIDNTLTESGSELSTSDARVKFAKKITGNDNLFTLHENNTKITFSLNGAIKKTEGKKVDLDITDDGTELGKLMSLEKLSSKVIYEDILDGVDVEYIVTSNDIKENIIVKEKKESYEYSFTLKLNNLTALLTADGDVIISDYSGNTAYTIPAPVIFDANGRYAEDSVGEYTLTDNGGGKYTFTVSVSAAWMNAEDRAFPVTVDPTVETPNSYVLDTSISSAAPNSEFGANTSLYVTSLRMIHWKTTSLPQIPSSAYIVNANLTMRSSTTDGDYVAAYEVITDWDESLTWNQFASTTMPKGRISNAIIDYNLIYSGYYSWNITSLVEKWYTDNNYGVAFKGISGYDTAVSFYSSENSNVSNRPSLTVTYVDMKGNEDYLSYSNHSVGSTGTGAVNHATGNMVFSIPTLSTTDSIMPFTPTLINNTQSNSWRFNMEQTIRITTYTDANGEDIESYIWTDADGTEHYFTPTETEGHFADDDGLLLTMYTEEIDGSMFFKIKNVSDTIYRFNPELKLDRIRDRIGNRIEFHYDESGNNVTEIEFTPWCGVEDENFVYDEYEDEYNIDYGTPEELETPIVMLRIAYDGSVPKYVYNCVSGDAVIFRYTEGALTEVERITLADTVAEEQIETKVSSYYSSKSNNTDVYVYETATLTYTDGKIASVTESRSGYGISYTYNGTRVASVTESTGETQGQKLSFDYRISYTDVRNSGKDDIHGTDDDIVTRYIFDSKGRSISSYIFDATGTVIYGAFTGEYETQDNIKNNLKKVVKINDVGANLLLNGGFEDEDFANWSVSDNVEQTSNGGGNDYYRAEIPYGFNTEESIAQYVKLDEGTYNLSFNVYSNEEYGCSVRVLVTSLIDNNAVIIDEQVALNSAYTAATRSDYFSKSFSVTGKSGTGADKICIAIYVYGNTTLTEKTVIIDDVMLSEGVGASEYSLVEMGSFEDTNINSNGYSGTPVMSRWDYIQAPLGYSLVDSESVFGQVLKLNSSFDNEAYVGQRIYTRQENSYGKYMYTVSGFAKAVGAMSSENASFRIAVCVDGVYYYYDFQKDCTDWQFVSGTFTVTNPNYIDVYVEYSGHLNGYALFDSISVALAGDYTDYTYYANGMPKLVQGKFYSEYYEYNGNFDITRKVTSNRDEYVYAYDYNGNLASVTHCTFTDPFYDKLSSNFSSLTRTQKNVTSYTYNSIGLCVSVVTTASSKITSSYEYSEEPSTFGMLVSETDSLDRMVRYFYDSRDGKLLATVNLPSGNGIAYEYDEFDRLEYVVPASCYSAYSDYTAESGAEQVEYEYDLNNRLSKITTESTVYTFTYDGFGNSAEIKAGNNTLASYEYNSNNGKLNKVTYGNGYTETYEYNELELLDKVWYNVNGGENVLRYSYEYTAEGELTRINDHTSERSTAFTYYSNGKVSSIREYHTDVMYTELMQLYSYDDQGRVTDATYELLYETTPGSQTYGRIYNGYTYADGGNVISSTNGGATTNYEYDGFGRLRSFTRNATSFSNTVNYTYSSRYISNGNNTSAEVSGYTSTVNGNSTTYAYTYDGNGNITKVVYNVSTQIRYYYDNLGQLVREDNGQLNKTYVYTYDNAGNITSKSTYILTAENVTPTNPTDTESYEYSSGAWGDQLTKYNGVEIEYDAIGNPLEYYNGAQFTWLGRQLVSAEFGNIVMSFTYNDEGLRTSKTVNGVTTTYYLSGSQIIGEETSGNITVYLYDASGSVIGMQYHAAGSASTAWDSYWFEKNLQGDVVAIYNSVGAKLISYTYDAWGNFTPPEDSTSIPAVVTNNPFTYRGYYYDYDLGLYYLQSRYYDSNTGRFISADSYVNANGDIVGFNMYAYCSNNPVMFTDETGEGILGFVAICILGISIYEFVVSMTISDSEASEVKYHDRVYSDKLTYGEYEVLYFDSDAEELYQTTTKIEFEAGVYSEHHDLKDNLDIDIDFLQVSNSLGYTNASLGIHLARLSVSQEYDIFGKRVKFSIGVDIGFGAGLEIGKKNLIEISCGVGGKIGLEVIE